MTDTHGLEQNPDARTWGLLCHLAPLLGIALSAGILSFVGPLVVWLMKREQYEFVNDQGKEAINFQITVLIITVVCIAIAFASCGFLTPIVIIPIILQVVFAILAGLEANKGVFYRYPFNLRIVK